MGSPDTSKMPHIVDEHTLEISQMLTVSTSHISAATAEKLPRDHHDMHNEDRDPSWGPSFARAEGWMFYVPAEKGQFDTAYEGAPKDLLDVLLYANSKGCEWLLFDSDGPTVEGLYEYDW